MGQIVGFIGQAAVTGLEIGTLYGAGATNLLLGAGGAVSYRKTLQQRNGEIGRLQKIFDNVQKFFNPHAEEGGEILASDSGKVQITDESGLAREDSSLVNSDSSLPSYGTIVAQSVPDKSGPAKWVESLKKGQTLSEEQLDAMTPLERAKYSMTMHVFGEVARKRLDTEKTLLSIDQANRASFVTQSLAGAGQVAIASAELGKAGATIIGAASGFSLISSIFYLGASLRGIYASCRDLMKNHSSQKEIEERKEALLKQKEPLVQDFINAEVARLDKALDALKTEEALLKQSLKYHIINALAGVMGLVATALFIYGTQGLGLAGLIAYYSLVGGSSALPLVAMAYKAYSTNETRYLEELSALYEQPPTPPINLSQITDPLAKKWVNEQLQTAITPIGAKRNEDDEQLKDVLEQFRSLNLGEGDILHFLQELRGLTIDEEISSTRYANGIQEIVYPREVANQPKQSRMRAMFSRIRNVFSGIYTHSIQPSGQNPRGALSA